MELTPVEKMMSAAKVQLILQKAKQEEKPQCYHVISQYSANSCSKCEHSGDCHLHFLTHMLQIG